MRGETGKPQVIIVGSGPAGVSVAWPIVRAGLQVLMIDASQDSRCDLRPASYTPKVAPWASRFCNDFAGLKAPVDVSPKFTTPLARSVLEGFASRNGLVSRKFFAAGSLAQGGLSKIWGALAEPFLAEEFAGFPFGAEAMTRSYAEIAHRIGIPSASMEHFERFANPPATQLYRRYLRQRRAGQFELQAAVNAVNETAMEGREPCSRCGGCLYGCKGHSIYDSAFELPALQRFPNFDYASDHFVRAMGTDGAAHVLEVEKQGLTKQLRAETIVMAAGTIATSHLVLRHLNWLERPVPLLTNPAAAAAFLVPGFIGSTRPSESFSLGQLFYRFRTDSTLAAGVIYGADTLPLDIFAARLPFSRPAALRTAHALAPALLVSTCYLPGHFSKNVLYVHTKNSEQHISIEGCDNPEAEIELRLVLKGLSKQMRQLGAVPVPFSKSILTAGADAHYGGVFPMGGEGTLSTTEWGELKSYPNIFLADGSVLSRLPATHPTLTIMANADRIGHEIVRRLTKSER